MSFARPIRIPSKPISLSDFQKNALAAAMRDANQEARQGETLRCASLETAENRPVASEELLFIL